MVRTRDRHQGNSISDWPLAHLLGTANCLAADQIRFRSITVRWYRLPVDGAHCLPLLGSLGPPCPPCAGIDSACNLAE